MIFDPIDNKTFKALGKQDKSIKPSLRKAYVGQPQILSDRQVKFRFSSEQLDTDYDVIIQDGIDLSTYVTNPVCFFSHDTSCPIGKTISLNIEDGCLCGVIQFLPADNPFMGAKAEGVYQMVRDGYLSAVSIGFIATQWKYSDDPARYDREGADIEKCQIVEVSVVGVPANRLALVQEIGTPSTVVVPTPEPEKQADIEYKLQGPRLQRIIDALL